MRLRQTFAAIALMMAVAATAQNSIAVVKDAERVRYNPMIFGQFIEHFDNQVYGGIFDPGNALSDEDGFRKDVLEALREIKTPIVRWPGGCFVSTYHWVGGVGSERVPAYDKTWQVEDPNTFGTDEYIKWCRKVGCEPYICTNAGTGTPEEMSDWMEYCNLSVGKWGRMRMANGHTEPYNVKYWSVGNENWGTHELGARTVEEWGPMVRESAKLTHGDKQTAVLDVVLTCSEDGSRYVLAVVNKDPKQEAALAIDFASMGKKAPKQMNGWVLSGRTPDDYNDRGDEHVRPERQTLRVKNATVNIPAHSITFLNIE